MGFINTAFIKQFSDNVKLAMQQKGSRLRDLVDFDWLQGEDGFYDYLMKDDNVNVVGDDFTSVNTMHPDTVITEPEWSRRKITGQFLTKAYLIEKKDKIRLLADPTNKYVQSIAMTIGRKIDSIILNSAIGTAYTGKTGTVAVDLPTSQILGDGTTMLTLDLLMQAKILLDEADVDPELERYIYIPPRQLGSLLNTTEVKSSDYNTVKALVQGQLDTFLGFKFISGNLAPTEDITLPDGTTATVDDVICWVQEGVLLALNKEVEASIDKRPDKNNATQVFFGVFAGASRMDENLVVKIITSQA